jgi:hypothetical protein
VACRAVPCYSPSARYAWMRLPEALTRCAPCPALGLSASSLALRLQSRTPLSAHEYRSCHSGTIPAPIVAASRPAHRAPLSPMQLHRWQVAPHLQATVPLKCKLQAWLKTRHRRRTSSVLMPPTTTTTRSRTGSAAPHLDRSPSHRFNGARRVGDDGLRDAAEQQALQTRASVRSHNDQIRSHSFASSTITVPGSPWRTIVSTDKPDFLMWSAASSATCFA